MSAHALIIGLVSLASFSVSAAVSHHFFIKTENKYVVPVHREVPDSKQPEANEKAE